MPAKKDCVGQQTTDDGRACGFRESTIIGFRRGTRTAPWGPEGPHKGTGGKQRRLTSVGVVILWNSSSRAKPKPFFVLLFYLASSPKKQETKGLPPSNIGYNLPQIPNQEKSLGHLTAHKSSLILEHYEEHTPTFAQSAQYLPTKEYMEKLPPRYPKNFWHHLRLLP